MNDDKKRHWEQVYQTKDPEQVSWTQIIPQTSINFIEGLNLPKDSKIIDVGGGDSKLVDYLVAEGYTNITVLDISAAALEKVKKRLGADADKVKWIVSDIIEFNPNEQYDIWHDRAAFHFLTADKNVEQYLNIVKKAVNGYIIIGVFSENGPEKCSGLAVKQYAKPELQRQLSSAGFEKITCVSEDHITPFKTKQNFLFCSFKKYRELI